MNDDLFKILEVRIEQLLGRYAAVVQENLRLKQENLRLTEERSAVRNRLDTILAKLDGVESP